MGRDPHDRGTICPGPWCYCVRGSYKVFPSDLIESDSKPLLRYFVTAILAEIN